MKSRFYVNCEDEKIWYLLRVHTTGVGSLVDWSARDTEQQRQKYGEMKREIIIACNGR